MFKSSVTIIFLTILCKCIVSNENRYALEGISEELKDNAKSIVRNYQMELEIKSSSDAVIHMNYAVTILNKNGLDDSYLRIGYDKNSKIRSISGQIYDEKGLKIKKLANSDVEDFSAISSISIYDDSRIKFYDPEVMEYPFTVEYSYELHLNGFFSLPNWTPYSDYNTSIEKSTFRVRHPNNMVVRFFENNISGDIQQLENETFVLWEVSDLKAIDYEPFVEPYYNYLPYVMVATNSFEYDNSKGQQDTWNNLGYWLAELKEDRDVIPDESIKRLTELTQNYNTKEEKVCATYKYVQDNTRYVSVQLGIGGYQPFEADFVDRVKYGDCKALTNYTQSLLKSIGIDSYYTLVEAGSDADPMIKDFPSNQFNHVFLCVPNDQDTIWLECTSQNAPCGYLSDFTDDRNVLVVNENGGVVVKTPRYSEETYHKNSNLEVDLYDNGNATVSINNNYTGPFLDVVLAMQSMDNKDQEKTIYERLDLPKSRVNSFSYEILNAEIPVGKEQINVDLGNYGIKMGSNMFINPNLINRSEEFPGNPEKRISDIYIRRSLSENDTVNINLPDNIKIAAMPEGDEIVTEFGKYKTSFIQETNKILYVREFTLYRGNYSKDYIQNIYNFAKSIEKADKKRIALKIHH